MASIIQSTTLIYFPLSMIHISWTTRIEYLISALFFFFHATREEGATISVVPLEDVWKVLAVMKALWCVFFGENQG